MKQLFKNNSGRIIAVVMAAALMAGSLAYGLSTTLAASLDNIRLEQSNNYNIVRVGGTAQLQISGIAAWSSGDRNIATVPQNRSGDTVTITGVKAGTVGIGGGNLAGTSVTRTYQVVDPGKITGYDIPANNIGFMKNTGTKALDITFYRSPAPVAGTVTAQTPAEKVSSLQYIEDNTLGSQVEWQSLHPDVVRVEGGNLIAEKKGVTLLVGAFTDRWGVRQTIHYLFGVGVYPGERGSDLNALLEAIDRGEKIIDEYNNGNPNDYDSDLIGELQDAIDNGYNDIANGNENNYKPDAGEIDRIIEQVTKEEEKIPPYNGMPTGVTGNILPMEKAGDSSDWIEIARNGSYSLILRANCVKPNTYFDDGGKSNYNTSTLKTKIDAFYASLPEDMGLRKYAVMSDATSKLGSGADIGMGMTFALSAFSSMKGISVPTMDRPTVTTGVMFPLSFQEAGNFCLNVSGSPAAAVSNYRLLETIGDATLSEWHLRTPFSTSTIETYHVTCEFGSGIWVGGLHYDTANYYVAPGVWCETSYYEDGGKGLGIRPAVWVDSDIFD